jgi:hypothetical protein
MKKTKWVFLLVFLFLVGCTNSGTSSMGNNELEKTISSLNKDMTTLRNTNESLQELVSYYEDLGLWIDYELNPEITDKGIYSLSRVYIYDRMEVKERSFENQSDNFYYEAENIYDFKVSNDNKYIAMMYLDGDNIEEQYMEIYSHDKKLLYSYDLNDFNEEITDGKVGESSIIKFEGFTEESEYLWGGFAGELDIANHFMIDIKTGELKVFEYTEVDEFNNMRNLYPFYD